ncbi:hypothetical protein ABK040_014719 [Willaertia magna]
MKSLLLLFLISSLVFLVNSNTVSSSDKIKFTLLHTSDLHSHFEGIGPDITITNKEQNTIGHYARLLTLINKIRENNKNTLLLDNGDWYMGTLFHTLAISYLFPKIIPPELEFFQIAKYDAILFGNHEFDVFSEGLISILRKANNNWKGSNFSLPLITSNLEITKNIAFCNQVETEFTQINKEKKEGLYFTPNYIKTFKDDNNGNELKIGMIGVMGPRSAMISIEGRSPCFHFKGFNDTNREIEMNHYVNHIYRLAKELKEEKGCQVVVVMSHSGEPEDEELAMLLLKKEDNHVVDIMLSSHTHNVYFKKIVTKRKKNKTQQSTIYIHQAGPYGINLGVLQFEFDFIRNQLNLLNEKVKVPKTIVGVDSINSKDFERDHLGQINPSTSLFQTTGICFDCISNTTLLPVRIPITGEIPLNNYYFMKIEFYKRLINEFILTNSKFKYKSLLGSLSISNVSTKTEVGNIFSDCILEQVRKQSQSMQLPPIHVFLMPIDSVRTDISTLKNYNESQIPLQFSDVYRIFPLGKLKYTISNHNLPGEKLELFYLPFTQLKRLMVISQILSDSFLTPILNLYMLSMSHSSNIKYKVRSWGIPMVFEDKLTSQEEKTLNYFWKTLRHIKNSVARYYDFTIDNKNETEINNVGVLVPGWLIRFLKKVSTYSMGFLNFELKDQYGKTITSVNESINVVPFIEYTLVSECLAEKKVL